MNGQMKKYRKSLERMSEPIMLSQMEKTMDLRALMQYAKNKGGQGLTAYRKRTASA